MKEYKIFYLSTALSDDIYDEIVKKCRSFSPTFSGVGFDRNIGSGLSKFAKVKGISLYPIPSYPKYNSIFQKKSEFIKNGFHSIAAPLLNLPIIKEYSYNRYAKKYIKNNLKKDEQALIVISGLYRTFLRPVYKLKNKYSASVCCIVPDIPQLMSGYRKDYSGVRKILNKIDVKTGLKFRSSVDGFVFLSKYMNDMANPEGKEFIVVDGLCDIEQISSIPNPSKEKYIMYAGKISKTFGIDKLVSAFLKSDIKGYKLRLFGDGDYAGELKEIAGREERIIYEGVTPHDDILFYEKKASLLIEPRPSDTQVVKMSFPSKIIEYMASGTPVLTTKLPCFSDEYFGHLYFIEDEGVDGIALALERTLSLAEEELDKKGREARKFIENNKTLTHQCKKIVDFIGELANENR